MYPFERYIKILKGYVRNRNRNRLEGYIVECYTYEKTIEFCNEYLSNVEIIGLPRRVHTKETYANGKILIGVVTVSRDLVCQAHDMSWITLIKYMLI